MTAPEGPGAGGPLYRRDGPRWIPAPAVAGPWSPDGQHGGPVAALLTGLMGDLLDGWCLLRTTVELLGPVPVAPVTVEAGIERPGRRVTLTAARMEVDGRPVASARAWWVAPGADGGVTGAVGPAWDRPPPPAECPRSTHRRATWPDFYGTVLERRLARGTDTGPGPAAVWFRLTAPLRDDRPTTAAERAVAVADCALGIAAAVTFEEASFPNVDLTVAFLRAPAGPWVLVDAATRTGPGVALTTGLLADTEGPVGTVGQSQVLIPA